jgi:hypothetical protein
MVRGITRSAIFYDSVDLERFLDRAGIVFTEGKLGCYAFALLSNHAHLLLRTGITPIANAMRRLLTGYAVSFNKRRKRSGHSAIMARCDRPWQDTAYVLSQFSASTNWARTLYREFVEKGIAAGQRSDLAGGGPIRSNKGWHPTKGLRHGKGDERILGSTDFVLQVMRASQETWERTYALKIDGIDFAALQEYVARLFNLSPEEILLQGKYPNRVAARSVLSYFLVRELGMSATAVAGKLGIGQPAVSIAVARGEAIVRDKGLTLR